MDPELQKGMGYAIVGLLGLCVGKVYDYFTARLNSRVGVLEERYKECINQHKECLDQHKKCQQEREKDKNDLIQRDKEDREFMQKQIDELKIKFSSIK